MTLKSLNLKLKEIELTKKMVDLRIRFHTSSCPGCVQGESSDSRRRCQGRRAFKITDKINQEKKRAQAYIYMYVHIYCLRGTSESQSHPLSGTFLGQSWQVYSLLLVLLLSSSGEMLKRLISVLVDGCFILSGQTRIKDHSRFMSSYPSEHSHYIFTPRTAPLLCALVKN